MFGVTEFEDQAELFAQENDLSLELARDFLARIGDTPELADDGKVIVRDEAGVEIARVILPAEESSPGE